MHAIPCRPSCRPLGLAAVLILAGPAGAGDLPAAERQVTAMAPAESVACTFPAWRAGSTYSPLDVVMYGAKPYFAKAENPGYIPTVSTFFWGPYSCSVSAEPPARCSYTQWMQQWPYAAGSIVAYDGGYYIARHDNPGYIPTVSTWYWAPHDCGGATVTRQ